MTAQPPGKPGWGYADGTEEPEKLVLADADIVFPLAVSPDGEWLIYVPSIDDRLAAIRIDDPTEELTIARDTGVAVRAANFSPDGRWLAYQTEETGSPSVWVQPFPPDGRRWPVSERGRGTTRVVSLGQRAALS